MKTREGKSSAGGREEFDTHCSWNWIFFLDKSSFSLLAGSSFLLHPGFGPNLETIPWILSCSSLYGSEGHRVSSGKATCNLKDVRSGTCKKTSNAERKSHGFLLHLKVTYKTMFISSSVCGPTVKNVKVYFQPVL